jgi:hypothetical protein
MAMATTAGIKRRERVIWHLGVKRETDDGSDWLAKMAGSVPGCVRQAGRFAEGEVMASGEHEAWYGGGLRCVNCSYGGGRRSPA